MGGCRGGGARRSACYHPPPQLGAIAQLVERFHGMEEVRGSIPLSSTIMVCEACGKDYEPEKPYCPHCSSANQTILSDEEMIVNDYFE